MEARKIYQETYKIPQDVHITKIADIQYTGPEWETKYAHLPSYAQPRLRAHLIKSWILREDSPLGISHLLRQHNCLIVEKRDAGGTHTELLFWLNIGLIVLAKKNLGSILQNYYL